MKNVRLFCNTTETFKLLFYTRIKHLLLVSSSVPSFSVSIYSISLYGLLLIVLWSSGAKQTFCLFTLRQYYFLKKTENREQLRTHFSRKIFYKKTENWEQLRTHIPRKTFRKKLRTENNWEHTSHEKLFTKNREPRTSENTEFYKKNFSQKTENWEQLRPVPSCSLFLVKRPKLI